MSAFVLHGIEEQSHGSPEKRGREAPLNPPPRTLVQWQGYVLKAQQSETAACHEIRKLQLSIEKASARHADELADAHRKIEVLRGQLEVRQFALQHASEVRDAATERAEAVESELAALRLMHEERICCFEAEQERLRTAVRDAEAAAYATCELSRQRAERAAEVELHTRNAERTCATLRVAVSSLEHAKQQTTSALEVVQDELSFERKRTVVERGLLRSYACEAEQQIQVVASMAEVNARETERVEAALTALLAAAEATAMRSTQQQQRTVAQLRGHVSELEVAVTDQQEVYQRTIASAEARHEAARVEAASRHAASEAKGGLLSHQMSALAEAAQQIKAERASALSGLASATARLEELDTEVDAAKNLAAVAAAREAACTDDFTAVREHLGELGDQLNWLEASSRDAVCSARPLLTARDTMPLLDADAAFRNERSRWVDGVSGLHATIEQIVGAFAWLVNELQSQLAASSAVGPAATPAKDLHEHLATQVRSATAGLPSAFAPAATFEHARSMLVEALKAQAQLASQSMAHLISCAVDAEAVASLQAKQVKIQHGAAVSGLLTEHSVALAALAAELAHAEESAVASASLAWQHAGGLAVHANELAENEVLLHREAAARTAAEWNVTSVNEALDQARHAENRLRTESVELAKQLSASRAREVALEVRLRSAGLEETLREEELLTAVRQAEDAGEESAAAAAVAHADARAARDTRSAEGLLLLTEICMLEGELSAARLECVEARRACATCETARADAHEACERSAHRADELDESLRHTTAALEDSRREAASAVAAARRHAVECVEWASKARACEVAGKAELRVAHGQHAALVSGISDLDESVCRARAATIAARTDAAILVRELRFEEGMRDELERVRHALTVRIEEDEYARRERTDAKTATLAAQQAMLQRELRTLQYQLCYPALPPSGREHDPQGTASEALWATFLATDQVLPTLEGRQSLDGGP